MLRHSLLLAAVVATGACARTAPDRTAPPTPAPAAQPAQPAAPAPPAPPAKMARTGDVTPPEATVPPPEPPYDLAADQARRAKLAKEELGPRTATAVVADVFVVIGPVGWQGRAFDDSVALMRSAMTGFMNGRFGKKPSRAISVYLFGNAQSYESFCTMKYDAPCIAHFGFYQPSDRNMVMNASLGLGTLTHEIVHPLVEADFPGAPTWLNEGIASVFEQPLIPRPGEIHGGKNWRHPRLRKALLSAAEKDDARLDALFGMSDEFFRGAKEDLHYAQARYVCQWLDERGKLWAFYHKWRDTKDEDPTGEKAFRSVTGMTPSEAHELWSKWTLAL